MTTSGGKPPFLTCSIPEAYLLGRDQGIYFRGNMPASSTLALGVYIVTVRSCYEVIWN
jgi:hypothetical protein